MEQPLPDDKEIYLKAREPPDHSILFGIILGFSGELASLRCFSFTGGAVYVATLLNLHLEVVLGTGISTCTVYRSHKNRGMMWYSLVQEEK